METLTKEEFLKTIELGLKLTIESSDAIKRKLEEHKKEIDKLLKEYEELREKYEKEMICKNCKHWKQLEVEIKMERHWQDDSPMYFEGNSGNLVRSEIIPLRECHVCARYKIPYKVDGDNGNIVFDTTELDKLFYEDGESYAAGHYTGENFGCKFWEPKE